MASGSARRDLTTDISPDCLSYDLAEHLSPKHIAANEGPGRSSSLLAFTFHPIRTFASQLFMPFPAHARGEFSMSTLAVLQDDHQKVMVLARELSRYLQYQEPPSRLPLFEVRKALASVLIRHLKVEDWIVYPALMKSEDRQVRETACAFQKQIGSLAAAFREHMQKWTSLSIEEDWSTYRSEAATLLKTLERRVKYEEDILYPMALKESGTVV